MSKLEIGEAIQKGINLLRSSNEFKGLKVTKELKEILIPRKGYCLFETGMLNYLCIIDPEGKNLQEGVKEEMIKSLNTLDYKGE